MIVIPKALTDADIKAAAQYFGSMKWTPWIKVVETETVLLAACPRAGEW